MEEWKLKPARDHGLPFWKRLRSSRREGGLIDACAQFTARQFVRAYMRVWHRVAHEGLKNLPKECPLVMIANHASHLDSVVMASILPWHLRKTMFPLAAGDVFFETPVRTVLAAGIINALPMWRKNMGRHALDDLRTRLMEDRCGYILFPEGRRSPDGAMLQFKSGLGMLVAGTRVPVVPCYIWGAFEALNREQVVPRPVKIRIKVGKPLVFEHLNNDREGWQVVVDEVERAVKGLAQAT